MTTESQASQGPTATYCPNSENDPDDPTYRPHLMQSRMGGGKLVRSVEICMGCQWIDFAALDGWAENAIKENLSRRAQRIAVASDTEPFAFVERSDEVLSMSEIAFQALGAASMCWEPRPTGVFDSTRARSIGEAFMRELDREMSQQHKYDIQSVWSALLDLIEMIRKSGSATPLKDLEKMAREHAGRANSGNKS